MANIMPIKPSQVVSITVTNWDKYQGEIRKNSKAKKFSWWSRSNDFSQDDKMLELGAIGRDIFCVILDYASKCNSSHINVALNQLRRRITVGLKSHRTVSNPTLIQHLCHIQELGIIEIAIQTERDRDMNGTMTEHPLLRGVNSEYFSSEKSRTQSEKPKILQKPKRQAKPKEPAPTTPAWEAYKSAYLERYRTEPIRAAKQNGILSKIVGQVGIEEATELVRFYVGVNNAWYIQRAHPLELLLSDLQKILVEFRTGISLNRNQALSMETTSSNEAAMRAAMDAIDRKADAF